MLIFLLFSHPYTNDRRRQTLQNVSDRNTRSPSNHPCSTIAHRLKPSRSTYGVLFFLFTIRWFLSRLNRLCLNKLCLDRFVVVFDGFTIVAHFVNVLYIEIVSTYTYAYPKHFLFVMVFIDFRIFARRMAHVYVAGSTFHLKKRAFLQTFSFSIECSYGEDGY